jgi:hypothetical protein
MENGLEKEKSHFSITRDVFTARLESFIIDNNNKFVSGCLAIINFNGDD